MSDDLFGASTVMVQARPVAITKNDMAFYRYVLPQALAPCGSKFGLQDAVNFVVRFIESKADEILANRGRKGTWLLLVNDLRKWHRQNKRVYLFYDESWSDLANYDKLFTFIIVDTKAETQGGASVPYPCQEIAEAASRSSVHKALFSSPEVSSVFRICCNRACQRVLVGRERCKYCPCQAAVYCGKTCQLDDWPFHKKKCTKRVHN